MSEYENKETIRNLENKVNSLENKISKLEELITSNIQKKYFETNINFSKESQIPYLRRMNAFNLSDENYSYNNI